MERNWDVYVLFYGFVYGLFYKKKSELTQVNYKYNIMKTTFQDNVQFKRLKVVHIQIVSYIRTTYTFPN